MKTKSNHFFVTAIGTDSGKTLVSAILTKRLSATYWKPIQCGEPTDRSQIEKWFGNAIKILPERHFLSTPASPHFAAQKELTEIQLSDFELPKVEGAFVVEGAGGLLVPLNQNDTIADLILHFRLPVVLVVNHYLGSLNHSLLTVNELNRRGIEIAGIVFNGENFQNAEDIILKQAKCKCWLRIPRLEMLNEDVISDLAAQIQFD